MDKVPVLLSVLLVIAIHEWNIAEGKILPPLQDVEWDNTFQGNPSVPMPLPVPDTQHAPQEYVPSPQAPQPQPPMASGCADEKSCEDLNGDACGCTMRGCDYHVAGGNRCVPDQKYCNNKQFWPGECRRKDSFYSVGGVMCENSIQDGECRRDPKSMSNYAVNLNGRKYTDRNNINYCDHNATVPVDASQMISYKDASDYGTSICKREGRGDVVAIQNWRGDLSPFDEQNILYSYIEGKGMRNAGGNDKVRCLKFEIPLREDGIFELDIKVFEAEHFHQNARRFNVKLNGEVIFPEVGIIGLVQKQCIAIDLMMNFVIGDNQQVITMSGYKSLPLIKKGMTELELCRSECKGPVSDPSFIASSFSVTRLMGKACAERTDL